MMDRIGRSGSPEYALDSTVMLERVRLQVSPSPLHALCVRATVKVRRGADGTHAVCHGPRCIGLYDGQGAWVDSPETQAA